MNAQRLRLAVGFLTVVPVGNIAPQPGDLGRAARWFSAIGLALGAVLAVAHLGLSRIFSPLLSAAIVVGLWEGLTGGLHLDGLADCCDGLLASVPVERRLEVMRDPRLGAFGAIGLTLFLILKTLAVASLPQALDGAMFGLLSAPALARWLILIVARQHSARPGGMGAGFARGLTRWGFVVAALIPLVLVVIGGGRALLAAALAHLVTVAIILLARKRLGGVTGDIFGLTVELSELAVLLTFAANA